MELKSVVFDNYFLEYSYFWLNDPLILNLVDANPVKRQEQKVWFDSLNDRLDIIVKGIKCNNIAIGVFGLKHVNYSDATAEYWGYIGEKEYWGRGIGIWMIEEAFKIARNNKIRTLHLRVLSSNTRAINLYKKFKFNIVSSSTDGKFEEMSVVLD